MTLNFFVTKHNKQHTAADLKFISEISLVSKNIKSLVVKPPAITIHGKFIQEDSSVLCILKSLINSIRSYHSGKPKGLATQLTSLNRSKSHAGPKP